MKATKSKINEKTMKKVKIKTFLNRPNQNPCLCCAKMIIYKWNDAKNI